MADSAGANSLNELLIIADSIDERLGPLMLFCGIGLFVAGFMLMFRHLKYWQDVEAREKEARVRLFEYRKFRRRGTIACLMSVAGCAMTALYWAQEARVFAILTLFLFAALVSVLGLAILDLMSVGIKMAEPDEKARKKMVEEYMRLKEKQKAKQSNEKRD